MSRFHHGTACFLELRVTKKKLLFFLKLREAYFSKESIDFELSRGRTAGLAETGSVGGFEKLCFGDVSVYRFPLYCSSGVSTGMEFGVSCLVSVYFAEAKQ